MADAPGPPIRRDRRRSQMLEYPGEQHGEAGGAASSSVRRSQSRSCGRRRQKGSDNAEASGSAVLATSTSSASDTTATGGVGAAAENATSPAIPDQPAQATVAATGGDVNGGESAADAPTVLVAGTPDIATPPVVHVAQAAVGAMAPGNELHNCRAGDNETLDPPPGITIEIALLQFPPPRPTEGVHNRAPDKTSFRPQWNCFLADEPNREQLFFAFFRCSIRILTQNPCVFHLKRLDRCAFHFFAIRS